MPACAGGFPHSDAAASSPLVGSAAIFADWRVLRRLALPKHPSVALDSLARSFETAAVDARPGPGRKHRRATPSFCPRGALRSGRSSQSVPPESLSAFGRYERRISGLAAQNELLLSASSLSKSFRPRNIDFLAGRLVPR